jgi:hypothetical protein
MALTVVDLPKKNLRGAWETTGRRVCKGLTMVSIPVVHGAVTALPGGQGLKQVDELGLAFALSRRSDVEPLEGRDGVLEVAMLDAEDGGD